MFNNHIDVPKRNRLRKFKRVMLLLAVMLGIGAAVCAAVLIGGRLVADEADMVLDATTTIETADGEVIGELYTENRDPVPLEEIPDHVQEAFIAIEDRRFFEHWGIDIRSVARAAYQNILAMSKVEGGSTITQQLAKNLFLSNDKTWARKAKEAMAAIHLERTHTKEEILELYLNEIYFGKGVYGIEKAANFFFSKPANELTLSEGALLAGIAKGPNGYSPIDYPEKALNRRNTVLMAMEETGKISAETRLAAEGQTLGLALNKPEPNPWSASYIDLVMKEAAEEHQLSVDELQRGGYRIVVNMDKTAQAAAYEQFQHDEYFPGSTDDVEGAFVMMEHETGEIVSAISGRNYSLGDLNRVTVARQPGSTIKPIAVYAPALMQEETYTPYTVIPDQQMNYDGYTVSNVDGHTAGSVTIYDAIKMSKNTSAVWLLEQIGVDYAKDYLEKMNINLEDEGLAIALGGLSHGISPQNLMESYGTFGRGGDFTESYTINAIYNQEEEKVYQAEPETSEVFSPQTAWDMTEMLEGTVESGTASPGEYGKALAGKTGTTEHTLAEGEIKDAWFVGYTPKYTAATWMGFDQSGADHYLTGGSSYPTSLTKAILSEMDQTSPLTEQFIKPEHVEGLQEPIDLPQITNLEGRYTFGGFTLIKGELTWDGSEDDRVAYRIYREKEGIDERIGEVEGQTTFEIGTLDLLNSGGYYVVPYDPLTKLEGERSNTVRLSG